MNQRRKLTKDERMAVYEKTNGHCAYCGCELEYKDMQVDHVIPINEMCIRDRPHIDGCTIVTESGFCSVMGHPYDIIEGLFIKRTKIDDITTVIAPSVKEVSVLEGNIHAGYYIDPVSYTHLVFHMNPLLRRLMQRQKSRILRKPRQDRRWRKRV